MRRNWLIGQLIVEEERKGNERADYGVALIKMLSKRLTEAYGKGFTKTNLYSFAKFYEFFPEIFHAVSGKCGQLLSWTHYRVVVQEINADARKWYVQEALSQNWSVRTLHDNAHLFASKYMTYMPTTEQLKAEIERQKTMFLLKQDESM